MKLEYDHHAFQDEGVEWLCDGAATKFLADDCGTGKSIQAKRAADRLEIPHIQVICPAIAVEDWYRKFMNFPGYERKVYRSFASDPVAPAFVPRKSVIINSFNAAVKHRGLFKRNPHGGLLIEDEAQYAKAPTADRTLALYGADCAGFGGISQNYDLVWCLSGTPAPNGDPRELWPHLRALRPYSIIDPGTDLPYSYGYFGDHFCRFRPGLGAAKVVGVKHEDELRDILGGRRQFMLRRLGTDVGLQEVQFEVYPMLPRNIPRELDPARWPELTERLDFIVDRAGDGDLDAQLEEQIATLRRLTGLLKVEATTDLVLEELRGRQLDRVVIFAYSVDVVNEIAKRLGVVGITGMTPNTKRWAAVDAFNNHEKNIFVGQILSCMTNLSLQDCRNVIYAESDWVPENNYQAAYRVRRIDGHRDPILARIICLAGTIDEPIQYAARRKARQARQFLPTRAGVKNDLNLFQPILSR